MTNKCRVLVVDDQRDCADSLTDLLCVMGHDAKVAYDGPSALAIAATFQPSYILLDIGMPGMDGYAVARHLRATGLECILIAVTGYGQPQDVQRCLAEGFDFHILKPAAPSDIAALICPAKSPVSACA